MNAKAKMKLLNIKGLKMIETSTALMLLWWSMCLISQPHMFAISVSYNAMSMIGNEMFWGILSGTIGVAQIMSMLLRRCQLRKISLLVATGFWTLACGAGFFSALAVGAISTGAGVYAIIAFMTAWAYVKLEVGGCDDNSCKLVH